MKYWCEDNVIMHCVRHGEGTIFVSGPNEKKEIEDCTDKGQFCKDNDGHAMCVDTDN
jgi:hypothetical protein